MLSSGHSDFFFLAGGGQGESCDDSEVWNKTLLLTELEWSEKMYVVVCSLIYSESQTKLFTLQLLRLLADFFASAGLAGLAAAGTLREGEYHM